MQVHVKVLVSTGWNGFLELADTYQEWDNQTTGLLKVNITNWLLRANSKNKINQRKKPPLSSFLHSYTTHPINAFCGKTWGTSSLEEKNKPSETITFPSSL